FRLLPRKKAGVSSRLHACNRGELLAETGVGGLLSANVKAGIGRISRRSLAVLDVLEREDRLVAHLGRTLADIARRQARLELVHLHGERVGRRDGHRAARDLVLVLLGKVLVAVGDELAEAAGRD